MITSHANLKTPSRPGESMSRAISRKTLLDTCANAVIKAEKKYSKWSGGITMRAAPESLVQTVLAECLHEEAGARIILEQSFHQLIELSNGPQKKNGKNDQRRLDIAIFYKNGAPRILIEIKKITKSESLQKDRNRIQELLNQCPKIQCGFILAYRTAAKKETIQESILNVNKFSEMHLAREIPIAEVTGRTGLPRFLGGAVFRVDRLK